MSSVGLVTGSNKGLGLQVVKDLAAKLDGIVYLTSRDEGRGKAAMDEAKASLGADGAKLRYHQLDIDSQASVDALRDFVKKEHGRLDVLVNNAGIAYKNDSTAPFAEQAKTSEGWRCFEVTNATNYFATRRVCEALFPLLAPGARVVTVASRAGTLTINKCSPTIIARFADAKSVSDVDKVMEEFVELAQTGKHEAAGFPNSAYGMSKLGVIAMSELQAKGLAADSARPDIVMNSCCPGYVDTDMTSHKGPRTVVEGADTLSWLALLPPNDAANPVAQFVGDRKPIDWRKGQTVQEAFGN